MIILLAKIVASSMEEIIEGDIKRYISATKARTKGINILMREGYLKISKTLK